MNNYVTFVKDEEESRKVQEAVVSVGLRGFSGGVSYTNQRFLHFGVGHGMTYCNDFAFTKNDEDHSDYIGINATDIIFNPHQLDGAKQPEKMIEVGGKEYSESTLQMMIREHGK